MKYLGLINEGDYGDDPTWFYDIEAETREEAIEILHKHFINRYDTFRLNDLYFSNEFEIVLTECPQKINPVDWIKEVVEKAKKAEECKIEEEKREIEREELKELERLQRKYKR